MLNLPGLIVEGMKETDEEQTFTVSVKEEPPDVDCCLLQKLVSNGRKEAFFTDTPMFGKTVTLRMLRERPVIGFRLSTLARLAGKMPLN